jgi:hypothetical protein
MQGLGKGEQRKAHIFPSDLLIAFHAEYIPHNVYSSSHLPLVRIAFSNIHTTHLSISTGSEIQIFTTLTLQRRDTPSHAALGTPSSRIERQY